MTLPIEYKKNDFTKFLIEDDVNDEVISDFNKIPETLNVNGEVYELKIFARRYNGRTPYYEFEFNYYSENIIEFLLGFKVFNVVEISINHLLCDLKRHGHFDHDKDCYLRN